MSSKPPEQPSRQRGLITPRERRIIEANSRIAQNRAKDITYQHSIFCQTHLPYRDPGTGVRFWEREQGNISLRINAGEARNTKTGEWVELGLPFGPKARLILMDLNQRALTTQSPEIDVADSMTAYLAKRLRLDTMGRNVHALKDQIGRLSTALIRIAVSVGDRGYQVDTKIVTAFDLWFPKSQNQRILWPTTVRLSEEYFQNLMAHAVPLREEAIAALSHSAMALDLYAWLAQRMHRVRPDHPQFIPWTALKEQFGADYGRMDNFKGFFRRQLRQVVAVYPEAKLDLNNRGFTLHKSPPPVGKLITSK